MADNFPTRDKLVNRLRADEKALLPTSDPYNPVSILNAIAVALANRARELYDSMTTIIINTFARTATGQALIDQAADWGLFLKQSSKATGTCIFTGVAGTIIPADSEIQSSTGKSYKTNISKTISDNIISIPATGLVSSGTLATATFEDSHGLGTGMIVVIAGAIETEYNDTVTITVISDTSFEYTLASSTTSPATGSPTVTYTGVPVNVESIDTGVNTNVLGGSTLSTSQTIPNVDSIVYTQFSGIDGGSNTETKESLQTRLVLKKANPSTPFNDVNIELKAREITGTTRVWVIGADEANTNQTPVSIVGEGSGFSVVTFTTVHDLFTGMHVSISGVDQEEFNGTYEIIVMDDLRIAYFIDGLSGSATGGFNAQYSNVQPGQVRILFVRDGDLTITPSSQEIQMVKDSILTIKPAHTSDDDVIVQGPTIKKIDFNFTTLNPDTTGMRSSISQNLTDLFFQSSPGDTITKDAYRNAIQNSFDIETSQSIIEFDLSTPTANILTNYNEIPELGNITYSQ